MSQPLTKRDLVRSQWLHVLRTQEGQRRVNYSDFGPGNAGCALSMLTDITHPHVRVMSRLADTTHERNEVVRLLREAREVVDLSPLQASRVIMMNDGLMRRPRTWPEIADKLESWWAPKWWRFWR